MNPRRPLDIAIIGMACRFPGARDLGAFWETILEGRDRTRDVPADRWDPAVFLDPDSTANDRVYCQRGGYLDEPIEFDPARHGVLPAAAAGGEPEQFLILDTAKAALADAGLTDGVPARGRVEVVIGRGNYFNRGNLTRLQHGRIVAQTLAILRELHPEWSASDFEAVRADLKSKLPPFDPSTITGQLTNATAGRLANRLDLSGASFVVDAASASSLVALDLGARALVEKRADLALVGGVYLAADVDFPQVFCQLGALSRRGQAKPFGRDADGTLPGEGVGVVVLKRLGDAERDGDRIYAVLKGVGLASDGRRTGLATPSARGHARAIRRAYRGAGVDPASIGFVEGHGLGVPASDRAELRALRAVFTRPKWGRRSLGAVSALIGHAMPAAGMAGLIKSALALHNRMLPPSQNADAPHPILADQDSPFQLEASSRPWIHGDRSAPRRAGVSAFGFAGISAHAVLEEHGPSADGPRPGPQSRWETEAILLGAANRDQWLAKARGLREWLGRQANQGVSLKDLAYTLNVGVPLEPFRVGIVIDSPSKLADRLGYLIDRLSDPSCGSIRDVRGSYFWERSLSAPGTLAFLFPGEGSQYPGMLADLCPHFPEVRERFDIADRIAREQGFAHLPSEGLFSGAKDEEQSLWTVGTAINVVLSAQWGMHQLLVGLGLKPDAVLGHSSGEFLALASSGALDVDDQLEKGLGELGRVFERLEQAGNVPVARLVAVAADRDRVERVCHEVGYGSTIAIDNCPHQVVVAGIPATVETVVKRLKAQGIVCEDLPFQRAYHTAGFASALGPVREFFKDLSLRTPMVRIYSCAVACELSGDVEQLRRVAVEQWALPVAFRSTIEAMYKDGVRIFIDVGARGNLTGFVEDILRDRPHFAVAANLPRRSGLTQLNHLVSSLYAQGIPVRADRLYERRAPRRIDLGRDLPAKPSQPRLAVGFPEMSLSPTLAARLRSDSHRASKVPREAAARVVEHAAVPVASSASVTAQGPPLPNHPVAEQEPAKVAALSRNGHAAAETPRREPDAARPVAHPAGGEAAASEMVQAPAPKMQRPASSVSRSTAREQAVLNHLRTMDAFLETQRQVMGAYRSSRKPGVDGLPSTTQTPPAAPLAPTSARNARVEAGPWVGTIEQLNPGRSLVASRLLDPRTDPVADHHTLGGRRVSALDPSLKGLPVVPFTVMTEMLAQAASVLVPGAEVLALRDVQAHKWIRYESEPIRLELKATRDPATPDEVRVAIVNRGPSRRQGMPTEGPVVEGRVVLGVARPPAPEAPPFDLGGDRLCRFSPAEIYVDQWLFHGPAMQALTGFGRSTERGIEGTLTVLPLHRLLPEGDTRRLRTDPVVLDAFTQLLGSWGLDVLTEGDVIFPLRVAEISFFGQDPPEGSEVSCRISVREFSRHLIRVEADLVRPDGRVWVHIGGWEDWRFHWPERYRDQFRQPDRTFVGEPLTLPGGLATDSNPVAAVWLEPPADMGKPIWRDVLEWVQLGPEERAEARADGPTDREWTYRLWERVAAKEAVRRLWLERGGTSVYPADLAFEIEANGHPRIRSLFEAGHGAMPAIAVAHAEGVAVALAAIDPNARPSIAIESLAEPPARLDPAEIDPAESALVDAFATPGPARAEWLGRLRCARAAALQTLGFEGNGGGAATRVVVIRADERTGEVLLEPFQARRSESLDRGRQLVRVMTARRGEHVWAWCLGHGAEQ